MSVTITTKVDGVDQLARAMRKLPLETRKKLTKAMRLAARPAAARAEATVHWSDGVRIRARQTGAAVGSPAVVPPIIEFGNKAVIGPGGKVAPHVRKLHKKPALIDAVESTLPQTRELVEREMEAVLEEVLAAQGALGV